MDLPWFMTQEPPPNYVAGLGRGAQGFTTRSDIGPARNIVDVPALLAKREGDEPEEEEEQPGISENGNNLENEHLFAGLPYDKEDEEADRIWGLIDARMDSRRKARREELQKQELEKYRQVRPKIQQSFADLKQELKTVTEEEWMNIPDIGDKRSKTKKQETFTPVPDTILEGARKSMQYSNAMDTSAGLQTSLQTSLHADLTQMGQSRQTMLKMQLQHKADAVKGQTSTNARGYLTDLNSLQTTTEADIVGIKRSRALLDSVTRTNPDHAAAWIAAARVEITAGKLAQARKLVRKGCKKVPKNEDIWLECAKLHPTDQAKEILAEAVSHLPKSVKIWMRAASLENDVANKKQIYREGLKHITNSEELWKSLIELEDPEDAKVLLARAIEAIPHCVEMRLALAHLETIENAKNILNQAIKAIPTDPVIWIEAVKLQEASGNIEKCNNLMHRAISSLSKRQVNLTREMWLEEAEKVEASGSPITCKAIVFETIELGLEDGDKKARWMEDAQECIRRGSIQTARAIYEKALQVFPKKKSIWLSYAELERSHGNAETLYQLMKKAVEYCPTCETIWLMSAKELWLAGELDRARGVLREAFAKNSNSEAIWLAAAKLEVENRQFTRARALLKKAREAARTPRVWLKSAILERELGDYGEEKQILLQAIQTYPNFPKFWMMLGQLLEKHSTTEEAAKIYKQGNKACPTSRELWVCASRCMEKQSAAKARSLLERARLHLPSNPHLWLEAVRVEHRANNPVMVETMLARGLKECPNAGILWAEAVKLEPVKKRTAKVIQALRVCNDDPYVLLAAATVFWEDRKVDKARSWFNRAVTIDPLLGDAWATFYKFELQHGTEEQQEYVRKKCVEAEPRYGENWTRVSKAVENAHLPTLEILNKVVLII